MVFDGVHIFIDLNLLTKSGIQLKEETSQSGQVKLISGGVWTIGFMVLSGHALSTETVLYPAATRAWI